MLVTIIARRGRAPSKVPSVGAWHLPCSRRRQAPSKRTPPQGETKKRRGHHAARPKGHHSARPRGALIETRTRTPYATPPPRGLPTWGDDQTGRATIGSASDGDKPRRDGGRAALGMLVAIDVRRGQAPSKRTSPQGETKRRRGHHAARPKGHHSACPSGALIETRTRTPTQRRHHVACPRRTMIRSHATIRSAFDGDKPRRDGELARLACWLRLSLDGGEPRRNEQHRPTGINPVETNTASRRD